MADEALMFDDLPAFDDMPSSEAAPQQDAAPLRFDDIPAFDDMPSGQPEAEGALATFGREAAHGAVPAAAGFVGLGAGAQAGAALGALTAPVTGPVGPIVGGLVGGLGGMVAASMGANAAQDVALKYAGFDDDQQRAANREQNKWSAFAGEIAPGLAGASPAGVGGAIARQAAVRGGGAAVGGAFEAGQEYLNEGHVDPAKVAAAAAAGAVFPSTNRVGETLMGAGRKMVPGRPNRAANPDADQAHADVGDETPEVAASSSALAEPPPAPTGDTTGNPQSAPQRSARDYGKGTPAAAPEAQPTTGEIAPDVALAVTDKNSPPYRDLPDPLERKEAPQGPRRDTPPIKWEDIPANDPRGDTPQGPIPADASALATPEAAPVVEAGFPQAGEPVAMGANDAAPMPADMPTKAAKAIAKSKKKSAAGKTADEIEVEAETGPVATVAQMDAANAKATPRDIADDYYVTVGRDNHAGALKLFDEDHPTPTGREKLARKLISDNVPPELKGETPINASVTDAQLKAGNYPKARTTDFGKPMKIETHADDIRRGKGPDGAEWEVKMPYDYGYFNKTKGADKDHIDFARPKQGDAALGDKHYIIDQRNADTGKFDEHKVFTYVKDEAAARDLYGRGFSDGKGPDRLGAITEVSRGDLVKWLQKHTNRAAKSPYGKFEERVTATVTPDAAPAKPASSAAPSRDPKVVERAKQMMVEQGLPAEAIDRFMAMEAGQRAAEATKFVNAKLSKTGVVKGAEVARIRPKAAEVPGAEGITARSKADAERKGKALSELKAAADATKPGEAETPDQLRARLTKLVELGGKAQGDYRPNVKPASWLMVKQAKQMLAVKKWTPAKIEAWNANEKLLRSGNKDAVADVRGGNRIEADIARSRRSGDDAVANAEKNLDTGRNSVEDDMLNSIDAKRIAAEAEGKHHAETAIDQMKDYGSLEESVASHRDNLQDTIAEKKLSPGEAAAMESGFEERVKEAFAKRDKEAKFDVPHEEAEAMVEPTPVKSRADLTKKPKRKVVDAASSELAKIDTKPLDAAAKRKLEAAQLQKAKAASKSDAPAEVKSIKIADPKEVERLNALMNKAAERGKRLDTEVKSGFRDTLERFAGDESGALDINKFADDVRAALKMTHKKTYIAKTSQLPHSDYVRSLSDELHVISQQDKEHRLGLLKMLKALPEAFNNKKTMEKVYLAREQGKLSILTPEERQLYDAHLKPLLDETDQFVAAIRAIDPDRVGPDVQNHISRIVKSDAPDFSMLKSLDDDPTRPDVHINAISTNANAAKFRKFVALERVADGKRFVISPSSDGYTLWQKYKSQRIKDPGFEFEAGQPHKIGNVDYIMRDAFTPEIEANARGDNKKPIKYYKNAALSTAIAHAQLGSMARHLAELHRLTNTAEFEKYSTRNAKKANELGWEESKLPNMKGVYMDPHLRYVFDDYAKAGFNTPDFFRNLSQGVTKLLFWSPAAHLANVGAHWWVGRGWDWLKPSGMKSLVVDGARAMKSVITQDEYQTKLREHGAGTIYGGVLTKNFTEQVFKRAHEEMTRDPSKWGPIADKLGVNAKKLFDAIYDNSAKVMWAGNDMFLTQRVMELERKGMSMKDAIIDAERDIPNYRIPTTLITEGKWGRFMQQMAADPTILSFGRYHYGVFNSFANILKDAFGKDASAGDRLDAAGKMMAMAIMTFAVYPLWDKAVKAITGNEEAKAHRRGPAAVTGHIAEALEGKADIMKAMRSTTTVPPLTSTLLETLDNRDFRGKAIVEPGDVRQAARGDMKAAGRVLLQEGEHFAKGLISPYSTLANANKKDLSVPGAIRDALLDIKNPSAKGVKYEKMVPITTERDARSRFKQGGSGPVEQLYNKIVGYR